MSERAAHPCIGERARRSRPRRLRHPRGDLPRSGRSGGCVVADRGMREGILLGLFRGAGVMAEHGTRRRASGPRRRRASRRSASRPPAGAPPSSTALARSASSTIPMSPRRSALGYRSRAAFKLIELDDRFHLLKPGRARRRSRRGARRLDARSRSARVRRRRARGKVVGDRSPGDRRRSPGATVLRARFPRRPRRPAAIAAALGGAGRCRAVRHGGAGDRPRRDRPRAHRRAGRGGL